MGESKGSTPLTTRVDPRTRDLVDNVAEDTDLSRSGVMRGLLELLHCSEDGELACPACNEHIQIPIEGGAQSSTPGEQGLIVAATQASVNPADADQSSGESAYTGEGRVESDTNPDGGPEVGTSGIYEELKSLKKRMSAQEETLANVPETPVEAERIHQLRRRVTDLEEAFHGILPRIEAVVHLSRLSSDGRCPVCGDSLSVERSFTEFGQPPALTCQNCEHTVGYIAD